MKTTKIVLVIAFLIMSCSNNDKNKGFYDYSRVSYIYRLPVIEPYEITSRDNGANWVISFKDSPPAHAIQFIKSIGRQDSIFVVYSPMDLSVPGHPPVWLVVDAAEKKEKVFTEEKAYMLHLKSNHLEKVKLYDIQTVFMDFDKKKKLPPEWLIN
jgi:hypothetical protein